DRVDLDLELCVGLPERMPARREDLVQPTVLPDDRALHGAEVHDLKLRAKLRLVDQHIEQLVLEARHEGIDDLDAVGRMEQPRAARHQQILKVTPTEPQAPLVLTNMEHTEHMGPPFF